MNTSASWEREMSASVLAAGCTISSSFMIVAPSFDMVIPCTTQVCQAQACDDPLICLGINVRDMGGAAAAAAAPEALHAFLSMIGCQGLPRKGSLIDWASPCWCV